MTRSWVRWVPVAMGIVAAAPLLLALLAFRGSDDGADPEGPGAGSAPAAPGEASSALDSATGSALRAAPFRLDGRPSRIPYDPTRGEQPQAPAAPPNPTLVLVGLVGGPVPAAMINGIPGREGPVVLAVGDTIAGLRIRRIALGSVVVAGRDTTWLLTLPREE